MLDLEGTITSPISHSLRYHVRPHAEEFLRKCTELFDEIYMNTSVPEPYTDQVMKQNFPFFDYKYWLWRGRSEMDKKTNGFEIFRGNAIIFVDDCIGDPEKEDIERLRVHYIKVRSYNPKPEEADIDDSELVEALAEINRILSE